MNDREGIATVTLTNDERERMLALERIEAAAVEWRAAIDHAMEVNCDQAAISTRVLGLLSELFGVDPAMMQAMRGLIG